MDWIPHSRWRLLAAPIGPSEVRRTERWLATARVSFAVCAFFAVWMYPTRISCLHWLLGTYVLYSTGVMLLLKFYKHSTSRFRAVVQGADLLWPALIYLFPEGRNLFFVFFVFVLAAATYRWGLPETVGTAAGSLILLSLESVVLRQGLLSRLNGFFLRYHWPELGVDASDLELKKLLIPSVCLLLMGCLLGYLAEQHKVDLPQNLWVKLSTRGDPNPAESVVDPEPRWKWRKREIPKTKNGDFPLPWKTQRARFPHFHRYGCCYFNGTEKNKNKTLILIGS